MQKLATSHILCVNEEFTFEDLKRINLDDYDTVVLLVKFLRWCQFDIRNEYEEHWNSHTDRARVEDIIRLRSSRSTLEKVGNIYGITRERIRQIEAKAVRKLKVWEKNHNYLAKMAVECGCCSVINVIKLEHNQFVSINRSVAVELRTTLEAFGTEHKKQIMDALEQEGYQSMLVRTNI